MVGGKSGHCIRHDPLKLSARGTVKLADLASFRFPGADSLTSLKNDLSGWLFLRHFFPFSSSKNSRFYSPSYCYVVSLTYNLFLLVRILRLMHVFERWVESHI